MSRPQQISLRLTFVDVFAARPNEGNLLAVVHDADHVPEESMAVLARRLRLSETSFLQESTDRGAHYRHRIFTIAGEIPFAGHPSLGSATAVAHRQGLVEATYVQETDAGLHSIHVELRPEGGGRASMRQSDPEFGVRLEVRPVAPALGLAREAFDDRLPVQLLSTGFPTLIVPLRSPELLARVSVDWQALGAVVGALGPQAPNCYVVAEVGPGRWRSRCFAADMSGGEDPATGSAAGPLAAYLARYAGSPRIVVEQGVEMGMPSILEADASDGIVVSGPVWIAGSGHLTVTAK